MADLYFVVMYRLRPEVVVRLRDLQLCHLIVALWCRGKRVVGPGRRLLRHRRRLELLQHVVPLVVARVAARRARHRPLGVHGEPVKRLAAAAGAVARAVARARRREAPLVDPAVVAGDGLLHLRRFARFGVFSP